MLMAEIADAWRPAAAWKTTGKCEPAVPLQAWFSGPVIWLVYLSSLVSAPREVLCWLIIHSQHPHGEEAALHV